MAPNVPAKYLICHYIKCECVKHPLAYRSPVSSQELSHTAFIRWHVLVHGMHVFSQAQRIKVNHQSSIISWMLLIHLFLT